MATEDDNWEVLPKEEPEPTRTSGIFPTRKAQLVAAFAVALVSDALSVVTEFVPPLQWAVDLATAGLLFLILGRHWLLLPGLIAEAIPGIALFPFWVLVVGSIAIWGSIRPLKKSPPRS